MSDLKQSGIIVSGLVSDIRSYAKKDTGEMKYSVIIFVPGSELVQVNLSQAPDSQKYKSGEMVKMRVTMGSYNGRTFFNEAV